MERRKFIIELIEVYRSLPALWDVKSEEYKDKNIKNDQYKILLEKFRESNPKAGKLELTQKLNSLRTNFRKELKRLEKCRASGKTEETTLWYYDQIKFIYDNNPTSPYQKILSTEEKPNKSEPIIPKESEPKSKKFKSNSSTDELVHLATQRLRSSQDSFQQIANVWTNKLSKMERNQRIFAEKLINDVVFNGELCLLNYNTTLTNLSAIRKRNFAASFNENRTFTNTNDMSQESNCTNHTINYESDSNDEVLTDQGSGHSEENYIVEDYDPLEDSVKLED